MPWNIIGPHKLCTLEISVLREKTPPNTKTSHRIPITHRIIPNVNQKVLMLRLLQPLGNHKYPAALRNNHNANTAVIP